MRRWSALTPFDGLLLLMVLIWGGNFSLVKAALAEIPHQSFNALRLCIASAIFLVAILAKGWPSLSRRDWFRLALLGIIGHFVYQLCFMGGLARTTASNSSLLLGCSPVAVALASALAGHENVSRVQWVGAGLSVAGIYMVVGTGAQFGGASLAGDFLTMGAVVCWAVYTVGSRALLDRLSPLVVTGLTMAIGTALYVPAAFSELVRIDTGRIHAWVWMAVVLSSILALNVAYLIWYTSVQRIGNIRTAVYSNVTPLVAMTVAAVFLGEHITWSKAGGAAAILLGVVITRRTTRQQPITDPPAEE
ncbi:MAG: DMT family transporter [Acidobacteria bacterium]|nr:DMT family transporter [Acidobacteriota bacterium]